MSKMVDFFTEIGHTEPTYSKFNCEIRIPEARRVCKLEIAVMVSTLLLFAEASPDPMVAGGAALAVLCGVVLLGGRSVVGLPLRLVRSLKSRELDSEPVIIALPSHGESDQDLEPQKRRFAA
jgi:hypothetical protein